MGRIAKESESWLRRAGRGAGRAPRGSASPGRRPAGSGARSAQDRSRRQRALAPRGQSRAYPTRGRLGTGGARRRWAAGDRGGRVQRGQGFGPLAMRGMRASADCAAGGRVRLRAKIARARAPGARDLQGKLCGEHAPDQGGGARRGVREREGEEPARRRRKGGGAQAPDVQVRRRGEPCGPVTRRSRRGRVEVVITAAERARARGGSGAELTARLAGLRGLTSWPVRVS